MSNPQLALLKKQLFVTWTFAEQALADLTEDECLWTPSRDSWTVRPDGGGRWRPDWVEPEPPALPPTSLGWILWHAIWWWSMVIDHSFGNATLRREEVDWPGAAGSMPALRTLHDGWLVLLDGLTDTDLDDNTRTRWPYTDGRSFGLVAGWVNIELMKNIAEMSLTRRSTPFYAEGRFNGDR